MTTGKSKTASAKAGAVARSERNGKPKTVDFKALTLTLPKDLPATIDFDLIELETEQTLQPIYRMLRSILGADQFLDVRNAVDPDDPERSDIFGLFQAIFDAYGVEPGESEASGVS